jgi:hypothetical protein
MLTRVPIGGSDLAEKSDRVICASNAHIQLKFQAIFFYTLVVLADVVDVDKPELLRLGSKRQWHTS